jgi:hypothetical protein
MALCALAAMVLFGCGNANSTVTGGDSLTVDPCQKGGANGGSRWQDLYACYFGPSGKASCGALGNNCHGSAQALGATKGLPHFVCGATRGECWQGLIASMTVPDGGVADPTGAVLYLAIHKDVGGPIFNNMPRDPVVDKPTYTFSLAEIAQISSWIQQGAQNN